MGQKKSYWELVKPGIFGGAVTLILTLASAKWITGGIVESFKKLSGKKQHFSGQYVNFNTGLPFGTSLYSVFKIFFTMSRKTLHINLQWGNYVLRYVWPFLSIWATLWLLIRLYKMDLAKWKNISVLTFLILLLPPVSFDYKLIHLLVPLLFFLREEEPGQDRRWALFYAIGFGLLLIPKSYLWLMPNVSLNVILNPLIMLAMLRGFFIEYSHSQSAVPVKKD